jgi:hypothetical protein
LLEHCPKLKVKGFKNRKGPNGLKGNVGRLPVSCRRLPPVVCGWFPMLVCSLASPSLELRRAQRLPIAAWWLLITGFRLNLSGRLCISNVLRSGILKKDSVFEENSKSGFKWFRGMFRRVAGCRLWLLNRP